MGLESSVPSMISPGACGRENMVSKKLPLTSNPLLKTRKSVSSTYRVADYNSSIKMTGRINYNILEMQWFQSKIHYLVLPDWEPGHEVH